MSTFLRNYRQDQACQWESPSYDSTKTRVGEARPIVASALRAMGKRKDGYTHSVRVRPGSLGLCSRGYLELLEDLGDATLGEAGAFLADQLSNCPFKFKYEVDLECWFIRRCGVLMDHLMTMWEPAGQSPSPPLSWQQQTMVYRHHTGGMRSAAMDISIRRGERVLTSSELKHGLRLTPAHFDALDGLRTREVALWVRPFYPDAAPSTNSDPDGKGAATSRLKTSFYHHGEVIPIQRGAVGERSIPAVSSRAENTVPDHEMFKFWFADSWDGRSGDFCTSSRPVRRNSFDGAKLTKMETAALQLMTEALCYGWLSRSERGTTWNGDRWVLDPQGAIDLEAGKQPNVRRYCGDRVWVFIGLVARFRHVRRKRLAPWQRNGQHPQASGCCT